MVSFLLPAVPFRLYPYDMRSTPVPSNRRNRHPVLWVLGIIALAVAIVLGVQFHNGTGVFAVDTPPSRSIPAQKAETIGEDDTGAAIKASGKAVPTKLKAEPAKNAFKPTSLDKIKQTDRPWHITSITPSGKLAVPVTITLPLDHTADKGSIVLVAVNHSHKADGWTVIPGEITLDNRHVTFVTSELSWFTPLWEDIKGLGNEIKESFIDGFSGGLLAKAKAPSCPNQSKALSDDYKLSAEAKETIYSCIDMVNGKRIVKIVNRVKYPLEIKHTSMTIESRGKFGLDLAKMADYGDHLVIEPGDEATFSVKLDHGDKATIDTDVSKLALGLNAVDILVKAILTIVAKTDVQGLASKAEVLSTILDSKDCESTLGDLNIGNILAKCLNDGMLQQLFSWKFVILGPLMLFISSVNLGYAMANAWDDGQKGKSKQNVTVTRPKPNPLATFVTASDKPWHVHGFDMWINSDGSGTGKWNAGPCDNNEPIDNPGPRCTGHSTYTFTSIGTDKVKGTVTGLWFTTDDGKRYNGYDASYDRPVGASFTLNHRSDTHLLDWKWDNSSYNSSTAALCDSYASQRNNTEQYALCGA